MMICRSEAERPTNTKSVRSVADMIYLSGKWKYYEKQQ